MRTCFIAKELSGSNTKTIEVHTNWQELKRGQSKYYFLILVVIELALFSDYPFEK